MGSIQREVSATLQADVSGPTQIALQVAVAEIPGLLLAVVHDLYEGFDTALEEELARQPQGPGAIAKAYVRASIAELRDCQGQHGGAHWDTQPAAKCGVGDRLRMAAEP